MSNNNQGCTAVQPHQSKNFAQKSSSQQSNFSIGQSTINRSTTPEQRTHKILELFPCRYRGIMATQSVGGKPRWFERKYLSDDDYARYGQEDYFLGVSFDSRTKYAMFDVDRGSSLHPRNDLPEWNRFLEWLESIGCAVPVIIRSSLSKGLHIYFFLKESVKTYALACCLQDEAIAAGFDVAKGNLEIFPNRKSPEATYLKHRLPLQEGSFILNSDLAPVSDSFQDFKNRVELARNSNDMAMLRAAMKRSYLASKGIKIGDRPYRLTPKQHQLKNDLEANISRGWTGHTQTESILKTIARYVAIFANDGKGVADIEEGTRLALDMAMKAPGAAEWCRNHHAYIGTPDYPKEGQTLESRIRGWIRCALRKYNPVSIPIADVKVSLPEKDLNPDQRKADALERQSKAIQKAIADGLTFTTKTKLLHWLIRTAKTSMATIQKNWLVLRELASKLIKPKAIQAKGLSLSPKLALFTLRSSCNVLLCKGSSDSEEENREEQTSCNVLPHKGSGGLKESCININDLCIYEACLESIPIPEKYPEEKKYLIHPSGVTSNSAHEKSCLSRVGQHQSLSLLEQVRDAALAMDDFNRPDGFKKLLAAFGMDKLSKLVSDLGELQVRCGWNKFKIRYPNSGVIRRLREVQR